MTQMTWDCAEARLSLGVYVLGSIDPAERALVDSHLAACRDCRDELAGLAGLPALLARVREEDAIALAADDAATPRDDEKPPAELAGAVVNLAAARRRRQRWRNAVLGAAAALVIAAGAFGGVSALNRPPAGSQFDAGPGSAWETVQALSPAGQGATIAYRQTTWGMELETKVVGIPVGTVCGLWLVQPNGRRVLAGTWITDPDENSVWYGGSTALSDAQVQKFMISVGKNQWITVQPS